MVNGNYALAIIGLGGMGNWHRETICGIDGLEVYGSFDISETRQEFAKKNGITPYSTLEELLADDKIDLVLIATPNDLHKEIAIKAMKAGKNVVCEKPVTLNSVDLKEMIDTSIETKKLFVVHQNRRWDEDFLMVKKMYEENILGDIFRIESRVLGARGIPGDWRKEKEHGGGMLLDWGVHLLDQALMMIDEKIKKVYGKTTNVTTDAVDDGFFVDLTFESGLVFHVEVGTNNFINLPRWYVLGINGSAVVEWDLSGKIVKAENTLLEKAIPIKTAAGLTKTMAPRNEESIIEEKLSIIKADIKDFYKNIMATLDGTEEIIVKNHEVARVMRLMETIFESSDLDQVLDFE